MSWEADGTCRKRQRNYTGCSLTETTQKSFAAEIAYKYMNTDYTATRMLGYLYRVTEPRMEDLIDEMLAILTDRNELIRKKRSRAGPGGRQ